MSITLELPEDLLTEAFKVTQSEVPRVVRLELACALYGRGVLTQSQGAELAELDRFAFVEELARRGVPQRYTSADLQSDVDYARGK